MKSLTSIQKGLAAFTIVLLPSFFMTQLTNAFETPKLVFLIVSLSISVVLFAVILILEGKGTFKSSPFDLPLFATVLVFIVSGILKTPNKMEAFWIPGIVTIVIASFLLYLFTKNLYGNHKKELSGIIFTSGIIVSVLSIFAFLGVFTKIPQLPSFMKEAVFSPLGGKLSEVIFLIVLLPLGISLAVTENGAKRVFYLAALAVNALAIVLAVSLILPGKATTPILLDFKTSWAVAIDTIKVSPLWGAGPGNYLTAISRFLPLDYNATALWAVRFSNARSFLLTLVTETGLLGSFAFGSVLLLALKSSYKNFTSKKNIGEVLSLTLIIVSFILFPANTSLLVLFFLLLALNTTAHDMHISLSATAFKNGGILTYKLPAIIVSILILGAVGVLYFFGLKAYKAEVLYKTALDGIAKNDGRIAYDSLKEAINTNPYVDRYHTAYAQVNLAIASGIAQKENPTETERATVAQLVQQAIREGKATVTLNSQRSGNWEVLAQIYRSIMPFAKGADEFAIQSYSQAAAFDPINPNLRVALGGTYYALGRYDEAIESFKLATVAKPDFANAYYNLAITYREKKDFDSAIKEIKKVLSLVQINSNDYNLAQTELENLEKNKKGEVGATDNLTPPSALEESNINPAITLPEDSTPPTQ